MFRINTYMTQWTKKGIVQNVLLRFTTAKGLHTTLKLCGSLFAVSNIIIRLQYGTVLETVVIQMVIKMLISV